MQKRVKFNSVALTRLLDHSVVLLSMCTVMVQNQWIDYYLVTNLGLKTI